MIKEPGTVYVVHCIDTEGPLYEPVEITLDRLKRILGLSYTPTMETVRQIQSGTFLPSGKEEAAKLILTPSLLEYNDHWGKIDSMLNEALSSEFRAEYCDSEGKGWAYSWFVMDHVDYVTNPQRRDMGYLNIFDYYQDKLQDEACKSDEINWHVHATPISKAGNASSTSFLRSPHIIEGLCRRIIDREWFPRAFRAGFHSIRPDSHWFLEQWVPFDFSNQAVEKSLHEGQQTDMQKGRFGDWRRAPNDWSWYHPAHEDYQLKGSCQRVVFRTLNLGSRMRLLEQSEVDKAFIRAASGESTIISFADHDWRDIRPDVRKAYEMIKAAAQEYPEVTWKNASATVAAKSVLNLNNEQSFEVALTLDFMRDECKLTVETSKESFGPQPFLAIKTLDGRYIHDNFDFEKPNRKWEYTFDFNSIPHGAVDIVGVGVCDRFGNSYVKTLEMRKQTCL